MAHLVTATRNPRFERNGPTAYAKAARKHAFAPTTLSTFFVRDGELRRFLPSVEGPGGARRPRKAPIVYPTVVGQQGSNGRVQESVRESHDLQDATSMENSTPPAHASTQGDSMAIRGAAPAPGDPYELSTIPGASQPSAPESMLHRVERFVQAHKPGMPHLPHLPRLPQLPHFGLGSKQPQEAAENAVVDPDGANLDQGETRVGAESIQHDVEYVVPVQVGENVLRLDLDTGSSDLWVLSTRSELDLLAADEHELYNPDTSRAALIPGATFHIGYGDGTFASGDVYIDTLRIGSLLVPQQAIEVATTIAPRFASPGQDGLLGLAWPSINQVKPRPAATPMDNLVKQGLIDQPLFTVCLAPPQTVDPTRSFYTFGYVDDSVALASDFTTVPVTTTHGFWEFPTSAIASDAKTFQRREGTTAIADTGTTLILLDDPTVHFIYSQIKGARMSRLQGGFILPTDAELPGDDLKYAPLPDSRWSYGAIQSRGQMSQDIWGDVFLKRVYAIFNQGDATLSLAQRAIDPASTSSLARTPFLSTSNAKINRRPMEGRGGEMAWTDKLAGAGGQPHL